ncbi:MAG: DUF2877 domain-containing protein [Anaerolineales bacterium]|nr:DUF2877 domain-containing protein [Anaerolineales bacterium]
MPPTLTIDTAGAAALQYLQNAEKASVLGITSRGVFLRLPGERVVFLSTERWRGPLTLNLAGKAAPLQNLAIGAAAQVSEMRITFPQTNLVISLVGTMPWTAYPPESAPLPFEKRLHHLYETARLLLVTQQTSDPLHPSSPLAALLPALLGWQDGSRRPDPAQSVRLASLQAALRSRQAPAVAAALGSWLGLGVGLTPSGDDLAIGLLLALSRWGAGLETGLEAGDILADLLPLAQYKTTLLSVNLLECAAHGQADERLLQALDELVSGSLPPSACSRLLADYGHTSGLDALVGIAAVLVNRA